MKKNLTIEDLMAEAKAFCDKESKFANKALFGVTDGKAVGTFIEHKFTQHLQATYKLTIGSSATGIDLPSDDINTDIKVTSIEQPQSSCPFKSPRQKIYGLGYNLLLFVYEKTDNRTKKAAQLNFVSCSFIQKNRTADFQMTQMIRQMIDNNANTEEIISYFSDRNLPADDMTLRELAEEVLKTKPEQGYLTMSNALQWRLQYGRVVKLSKNVDGIVRIVNKL